ncbi:conserved hypothetical protein [Coccidioides posadasii str. Silveira]|uniref:Methyltransferase n=2 Tax=Coccidioides posadasii (strain RMSCC 757 / Silveira) TaxID=443226 RepID=E9DEH1_COCPS|nr:conserved hypothetical protein [Coccidioides posadasii str. Silveira]
MSEWLVQVQVQDPDCCGFSDYGDCASDTTSLCLEIFEDHFENGRRYHGYNYGAYWAPNDQQQNEQLVIAYKSPLLAHRIFRLMLNDREFSMLEPALECDFADEYPSAEVIGTDLSPIQPAFVPPNVRFEIEDATLEWTFPQDHFDLIHVRTLYGSVGDWPAFYQRTLSHLKPGGWFDQLEMSVQFQSDEGNLKDHHILSVWSKLFIRMGEMTGKTFRIAELAKGYMEKAGFQNVTEVRFKLPVGTWSSDKHMKELGEWNLLQCDQGIEGWAMALLTRVLKWSVDEVKLFLAEMKIGLQDSKVRAYFNVVSVHGQKPPG